MKTLNFEQMENVNGGYYDYGNPPPAPVPEDDPWRCAAGIIAMAAIAGFAFVNPAGFAAIIFGGGGGSVAAVTGAAAMAIWDNC